MSVFRKLIAAFKKTNDPNALFIEGEIFFYGTHGNEEKALKPFSAAAELGHIKATVLLAFMYAKGLGTKRNIGYAIELYTKAADQLNAEACHALAEIYYHGVTSPEQNIEIIASDKTKAAEFYAKVIEIKTGRLDYVDESIHMLIKMRFLGEDVLDKDYEKAKKMWLEKNKCLEISDEKDEEAFNMVKEMKSNDWKRLAHNKPTHTTNYPTTSTMMALGQH